MDLVWEGTRDLDSLEFVCVLQILSCLVSDFCARHGRGNSVDSHTECQGRRSHWWG